MESKLLKQIREEIFSKGLCAKCLGSGYIYGHDAPAGNVCPSCLGFRYPCIRKLAERLEAAEAENKRLQRLVDCFSDDSNPEDVARICRDAKESW